MKNTIPNADGTLTVYQYDSLSGQLIGEVSAKPSPLEKGKAWLIPGGCTDDTPPTAPDGKVAIYDQGAWSLVDAPDPGKNLAVLAAKKDQVAAIVRARRSELLFASDYTQLKDSSASADWVTYREALRDIPKQAGFPENIVWPTPPSK